MFKNSMFLILLSVSFAVFSAITPTNTDSVSTSHNQIEAYSTKQFLAKDNIKLKSHHADVKLECSDCHSDSDNGVYKRLETSDCLTCHKSTDTIARRTEFMDVNHTNPHNSLHDRQDLDCYECHAEHKPSQNLCSFCHKTDTWMGKVP